MDTAIRHQNLFLKGLNCTHAAVLCYIFQFSLSNFRISDKRETIPVREMDF
jgi:hypothetical protein